MKNNVNTFCVKQMAIKDDFLKKTDTYSNSQKYDAVSESFKEKELLTITTVELTMQLLLAQDMLKICIPLHNEAGYYIKKLGFSRPLEMTK